ncbi:MAG TPA: pyridoxal-5'-phosphate-dependent protein beta subunit [Gemmatimonadetes bacterium]|nr:pyridoxal-5'-phosphate-dependent protein beta subunit [Gemmatimonadota bacterium]HCW78508.1 pyridoxal-5'-phosphate-dependent protein beta subunit [Gemmatimonadota bacterium]|tara:strand:+ start:4437 stop:5411 length:975 start_codon:yes stop_codon:yes gene_type:complete
MIIADLTLNRLNEARRRIEGMVHRTPLLHSQTLSARIGAPVWLKCENLQKTGAFKVRGALNRLLTLSDEERARGVSTVSAGNHAQAVAWAATSADVSSTVVMMEHASPTKVRASREYGAEVILHGDASAAFHKVQEVSDERGLTFVHPFDDADVVAGHASCGLEILEDLPETGTIVVPVGGGGLSSSIAAAAALSGTEVDVWGVEPTGAPAMHASFSAGQAVQIDQVNTVADGLGPPMAGAINYEILSQHARGIVLVEDSEIVSAMMVLLERTKLLAEPSGAAGLAALLQGKIEIDQERPVVIVISGGNADLDQLARLVQGEAC